MKPVNRYLSDERQNEFRRQTGQRHKLRAIIPALPAIAVLLTGAGAVQAQTPSVSISPSGDHFLAEDGGGGRFDFSVRIQNLPNLAGAHSVTVQLETTDSSHPVWINTQNIEKCVSGFGARECRAIGVHNRLYQMTDDLSEIYKSPSAILHFEQLATGRRILTNNYETPTYRILWKEFSGGNSPRSKTINVSFKFRNADAGERAVFRARVLDIRREVTGATDLDDASSDHPSIIASFSSSASQPLSITGAHPDVQLATAGPTSLPNFEGSHSRFTVKANYFNRHKRAAINLRFTGPGANNLAVDANGTIQTRDFRITAPGNAYFNPSFVLNDNTVRYDILANHFNNETDDEETLTFTVIVRDGAQTTDNALRVTLPGADALRTDGGSVADTTTFSGGPIDYSLTPVGTPSATISPIGSHLIFPGESARFSLALRNIRVPLGGRALLRLQGLGQPEARNFVSAGAGVQSAYYHLADDFSAGDLTSARTARSNTVDYAISVNTLTAGGGNKTINFTLTPRSGAPTTEDSILTLVSILVRSQNRSGTIIDDFTPDSDPDNRVTYRFHERPDLTIAATDNFAAEPATAAVAEADRDHGTFTVTTNNPTPFQQDASTISFFFRDQPADSGGSPHNITPGYGTLSGGINAGQVATLGTDYTIRHVLSNNSIREDLGGIPVAGDGVYAFRIIPLHDTVLEGMEYAVFGVRTFFDGLGETDDANIRGMASSVTHAVSIANAPPTAAMAAADSTDLITGQNIAHFTVALGSLPTTDGTDAIQRAIILFDIAGTADDNLERFNDSSGVESADYRITSDDAYFTAVTPESGGTPARVRFDLPSSTFASGAKIITFTIIARAAASAGENITLRLRSIDLHTGNGQVGTVDGNNISGRMLIYNIVLPYVVTATDADATEPGDGATASDTGLFIINPSSSLPANARVAYTLAGNAEPPGPDGTIRAGSDYTLSVGTGNATLSGNASDRFITLIGSPETIALTVTPVPDTRFAEPGKEVIFSLPAPDNTIAITDTRAASRTVTIAEAAEDFLPRIITATATDARAIEPGDGTTACDTGLFTVNLSSGIPANTRVAYTLGGDAAPPGPDGTTLANSDYALSVGTGDAALSGTGSDRFITLTGATGATRTVTLIVTPVADTSRSESVEEVILSLSTSDDTIAITETLAAQRTVTLEEAAEDGGRHIVAVTTADPDATEPLNGATVSDTGTFTIDLSSGFPADTPIRYALGGDAVPPGLDGVALTGSDYTLSAGTRNATLSGSGNDRVITFASAVNACGTVNLIVTPLADTAFHELAEKVILTLSPAPDVAVTDIPAAQRTVTIKDALTIAGVTASSSGEDGEIAVTLTLNRNLPAGRGELLYNIAAAQSPNDGVESEDFSSVINVGGGLPGTVPFDLANPADTLEFTLPLADDNRVEHTEGGTIIITGVSMDGTMMIGLPTDLLPTTPGVQVQKTGMAATCADAADTEQIAERCDTVNAADFTIADNDGLTLSIADAGVRESTSPLAYTVAAEAAPSPADAADVILDRPVTALLATTDGSAVAGTHYTALSTVTGAVVFPADSGGTGESTFRQTVNIEIIDADERTPKTFNLTLTESDATAIIASNRDAATVTIQPDPLADYDSTAAITINQADETSVTRTLNLAYAPNSDATVRFTLAGGTAAHLSVAEPDIRLTGGSDGGTFVIEEGGMGGYFTIPADAIAEGTAGTAAAAITFIGREDSDIDDETILFSITGITFADKTTDGADITRTDIGALDDLTIHVTDGNPLPVFNPLTVGGADSAEEKNNVPAFTTLLISSTDDPGTATVSFTLGGSAVHGTLSEDGVITPADNADYLLTVTDANGEDVAVRYADGTAARPHEFTLPDSAISSAGFTVTPIADAIRDSSETVLITATRVILSDSDDITTASKTASITITDYGTLPTATLAVSSEDGDDAAVTEGDTDDDLGIFTLELANVPSDTGIATVAYTLAVTGDAADAADITAAFGGGVNALGTPVINGDGADTFTMTVTGATTALTVIAAIDRDEDNETVTITITRITFADIGAGTDIAGGDVRGDGDLTVNDGICGRTQRVLAAITAAAGASCDEAAGQLTRVTELNLSSMDITELQVNDFAGLTELQTLRLNGNTGLTGLPDGVFNELAALQALYLNNTGLTDLPAGVFNGLDALHTLHLHDNNALALPRGVFDDVLDTLGSGTTQDRGLQLDDRFRGTLSFAAATGDIDQVGITGIEVRLDKALPAAVRVPYAVRFGNGATADHFGGLDGAVDVPAGATNATITATVTADVPIGATAVLTLSTPSLIFGADGESTSDTVVPQLAVVPVNVADTHTLTVIQGVCSRTMEVNLAITAAAAGVDDCGDVHALLLNSITDLNLASSVSSLQTGDFAGLHSLQTLNLSNNGLANLPDGLFDGLNNLQTLNLSGNRLTGLPEGILDDVLDTLTTLNLDDVLAGRVSFTATGSRIRQGNTMTINVTRTLPYAAVNVPYQAQFGGSPTAATRGDFSGFQDDTLTFAAGETAKTITIAAADAALPGSTATITLGIPTLPADTRASPETGIVNPVVRVAETPANAHALTVVVGILMRVPDDANIAEEKNNVPAFTAVLISSDAEDDGTATVSFTLAGTARFGALAEDGTDYLLAITHPDGNGGVTDITAGSTLTASGGAFTLPPNVHEADFTVTPITDSSADSSETVLITATGVTFSAGAAVTIAAETIRIVIADYGDLPTATLTVSSEDGDNAVVTEGDTGDDLGTFTLELANAPDGADIATVAYTLSVTGDAADITAAFGDGVNARGGPVINGDSTDTFTMTVTDGVAIAALTVIAATDRDENDETVTLTITGITFADLGDGTDIAGGNVQGDGDLTINDGICGRTQQVQDAIATAAGVSCYEAASQLTSVTELDLASTNITDLLAGDFAGLTELQTLNLNGNSLPNLPDGVFSGLAALQALYLNNTGLTDLPADMFNGLDALHTLHLHDNNNLVLPRGVFDDILDTLGSGTTQDRGLRLDDRFKGTLSFTGGGRNLIQQGSDGIEVRLNKTLPAAVRVPYTVMFGSSGTARHFSGLADGAVDIAAGVMSTTLAVAATADAPIGATAVLTLSTPSLIFGVDGENTSDVVVPQLAVVSVNVADTHTLTITQSVCARTPQVRDVITAAAGVSACEEVTAALLAVVTDLNPESTVSSLQTGDFAGLHNLRTLNLSNNGLASLPDGLFDGLNNLRTLDLSGNSLTGLPEGILDDVLDTLTTLNLDDALAGRVSFTATGSRIRQGNTITINVTRTLPYAAVNIPYQTQFGGSPTAATREDFSNFQDGTLTFAAGETAKTITIAAAGTAPPGSTATITLGIPALPADTRASPETGIVNSVVRVAEAPTNTHALTVVVGILMRVPDDAGNAEEKNNVSAFTTVLISNIEDDGTATVSFTLVGTARFGVLAEDDADYLLAITRPDGSGGVTDITAGSTITASGGVFTLPPDVHEADFTVTPITDSIADSSETVLITATGVIFSAGDAITIPGSTVRITITDYGDLPTATLTVSSEDGDNAIVTEGDTGDDLGTFTLELANAPDGADIATVAYTLSVADDAADITAAFGDGANARGGPVVNGDSADTFTMTVTDGVAIATLTVIAATDRDENNETVTLAITGITFADLGDGTDITGGGVQGDGVLTINDGICGRTQQVQDAIATAAGTTCYEAASQLTSVTELDLASTNITSLLTGDFAGLTGLQTLNLSGNSLAGLPDGVFNDLAALQALYLNNTGLTDLPADVFNGLDALQTLHLHNNPGLTTLPLGVFDSVLDTLGSGARDDSGLMLDDRFKGTLSFTGGERNLIQQGSDSIEVRLDKPLPTAVRVPYTVMFGSSGTARHFSGLADGAVDITAGVMSTTLAIAAIADAPIGATAVLTLSTPSLIFGTDSENTSDVVVPQLAVVSVNVADTHTLTITQSVCARTRQVRDAIAAAAGVSACEEVTADLLAGVAELNLASMGINGLLAGDFAGLTGLRTLDLSGNSLTGLPEGILDDVLDTLTTLNFGDALVAGRVSFTATGSRIRQGNTMTINVTRTLPYAAVNVPYQAQFGGSPTAATREDFSDFQDGTLTFAAGETAKTITIAAADTAPPDSTATITLGPPTLPADTRSSPETEIINSVVQVAETPANAHALTVVAGILIRVPDDAGNAEEKNNVSAFITVLISDDAENDGTATVSFTLAGTARFGALTEDGTDYLLAITHSDGGGVTDITAGSTLTASGGAFTLPPNVHRADFTVTPVADSDITENDETVLITATGVTFSAGDAITIPGSTVRITITDYGDLPTATLTVSSEDGDNAAVTEGDTGDDLGTFTLELANVPDGTDIATVAYTLSVAGDDADITAAFGDGANTRGDPVINGDDADTFTMTVTGGVASADITVIAAIDRDEDNETVTITITRITFADIGAGTDIAGGDVRGDGDLTVNDGICGRTQQVQDAIATAAGVSCYEAAGQLTRVTELDLASMNITGLLAGDFAGLTGLQTLNLSGNNLTSLPDGVFSGLAALQALYLNNTGLIGLRTDVFNDLDTLHTLHLHDNNALALPRGVFDDILDTLGSGTTQDRGLQLDDRFRGTLSFAAATGDIDQVGITGIEVRLDKALPVAVRVPYTVRFGNGATADHFGGLDGAVDIPAGATNATITATVTADVPTGATAVLTLSMPSLIFGADGESTSDTVVPQLAVVPMNVADTHTLTVIQGVCSRTIEVNLAITTAAAGVDACEDVHAPLLNDITELNLESAVSSLQTGDFAGLHNLRTLNLRNNGLANLPDGLFDGLDNLRTLNLSGNSLTGLPEGILDDVLDTLTTLNLDDALAGRVSFTATGSRIRQGNTITINVTRTLPYAAVNVPYQAQFGGSPTAATREDFSDFQDGTLTFAVGETAKTITIAAADATPPGSTATITLGIPTLPADTRASPETGIVNSVVRVAGAPANAHALTVVAGILIRVAADADIAEEKNNVPAFTTALISSDAEDDGTATVSFTLAGTARFGALAKDGTDYLLAITHPDGSGGVTDITAGSTLTASGGVFTLPPNVHEAGFTVTPITDSIADSSETVLITATGVTFSAGAAITITAEAIRIVIADYGDLPAATLAVNSEDGDNAAVTEGDTGDDLGTFTLELANAPDGTDIATVAYTLSVTGDAADITATFGDGVNARGDPVINGDSTDTFTMTVIGGVAAADITVIAATDRDENNETVTLAIAGITFADIGDGTNIAGGNIQGDGVLTINDGICGRTQQVQDAIATAAGTTCYEAADQLTRVTELDLASTNITGLLAGDFAGLTELQTLNLSGNSLTSLPDGVFNGLAALQALYLNNTGLTNLRADVFNGLAALHTLHLHDNNALTTLPQGVFDDILDTLGSGTTQDRGLRLDDRFRGTLSFATATGDIDQEGRTDIEVRLDKPLPAAVRVSYTVAFGNAGTAADFSGLAAGMVNIAAGMINATIAVATTADASISATAVLTLSTLSLTFGNDGENTHDVVVPQLAVMSANVADTHTLTIIEGICNRTRQVHRRITTAAGAATCQQVTPASLAGVTDLNLASMGIIELKAGDFAGLTGLRTLDLSGNSLTGLPEGILDNVLDTLTTLNLDDALAGRVSFTATDSRIRQGSTVTINVMRTLPYTAVNVPYQAQFGGSPTAATREDFSDFQDGTLTFAVGETAKTITIAAADAAPPDSTATITLGIPTLPADTRTSPETGIVNPVVRVARTPANAHALTVVAGILMRVIADADIAEEKNNVSAFTTLLISDIEDDGIATVSFTLAGTAGFGTLAEDDADYLLAITHLDGSGGVTDITAESTLTASGGVFTLPPNVHETDFTVTPITDSIADSSETVLITATGVTFSTGAAITIAGSTVRITIADYGDLPTATLTVGSEDGGNAIVTEGDTGDDLGTFTLELANAPDGIGIATVAYTLSVTGDAADITAAFGDGARGGPVVNGDAADTFTMTVTGGVASADITIIAATDRDENDETVTLTIAGITFADLGDGTDIVSGNIQGDGVLTVNDGICGRTQQVQDAIATAAGVSCYETAGQLTRVTELDLSSTNITSLLAGDFAGLTGLQILNLSGNTGLTSLPDGALDGLANLLALYLNDTGLTGLPADVFNGLDALQTLHLHNNADLTTLPRGVFDGVLDTLGSGARDDSGLMLDSRFRGTLSFTGGERNLIQQGSDSIEVRLDKPLPAAVRVPYTVMFGSSDTARHFSGLTDGAVDIAAGVMSTTLAVAATADAPIGATAVLTLSTPSLIFGADGESTSDTVVPQLAVVSANIADTHTLTITQSVCARTRQVRDAIAAAAGVSACEEVTAALLAGVTDLNLASTNVTGLLAGDFAGLAGLRTLDLSGNNLTGLPEGILDDVLDTLTTLNLGDELAGRISFTATDSRIRQGNTMTINVTRTLPYAAVNVPYQAQFGGSPTAATREDFSDFQDGTLTFAAGETAKTITIAAADTAPPDSTATITLGLPALPADTRASPETEIINSVVQVAETPANAHALTVVAGILIRVPDDAGNAEEKNNVSAFITVLISDDAENDGIATVSFTLAGTADFGTLAADGTDYLLAITHPDGSGGVTDITAGSTLTASDGTFTLPPNVHEADFTVTPITDSIADSSETVLITATGVTFSAGDAITIPGSTVRITIADYGDLPAATLTVSSEDGDNTIVTEGDTGDDFGTYTLELANAPDGVEIATVAYTLSIASDAADITAAFGDGTNARGDPVVNGDDTDTFTMTVTGGVASADITVIAATDRDENNETVTLAIAGITFADIGDGTNIAGGNIQGDGVLTINDGICGRTQQVQDAIATAVGATCYETAGQLTRVTELDLASMNITGLLTGDFAGLTELQTLNLSGNSLTGLTSLPDGVFSGLAALQALYLNNAGLTDLRADVFNGLAALHTLHLHDNNALTLPRGVFDDILDTLGSSTTQDRGLQLDDRFRGTLSFAVATGDIDQVGRTGIEVRLDKALPAVVRVPYTVRFGNGATADHFGGLDGAVDVPAGATNATITVTVTADVLTGATAVLTLSTPSLIFGADGESTSDTVVPQLAVVPVNVADTHTLTVIQGVCSRTMEVNLAITAAAADVDDCGDVHAPLLDGITELNLESSVSSLQTGDFAGLHRLQTLNLSNNGLANLPDGLFDGLNNLRTLDLSGNRLTGLPEGILDDVLDTLTTLNLNNALASRVSFTATNSRIRQGRAVMINVTRTLPYTAVNVPYQAQFGGSPIAATREDFSGFQDGTLTFAAGEIAKTITIAAAGTAPPDSTATITLGIPTLPADTRISPETGIVGSVVRVADAPANAHRLTVMVAGIRMRIRAFLEGALQ